MPLNVPILEQTFSLKVLAICGGIGVLLFGFWAYSHQSSSDPDTSPTKTNSSSL